MDEKRVFELAKKVAHCEKINNMIVELMQTLSEAYSMLVSEFDNAKSITRILGPGVDAINKYDEILSACLLENNDANIFSGTWTGC